MAKKALKDKLPLEAEQFIGEAETLVPDLDKVHLTRKKIELGKLPPKNMIFVEGGCYFMGDTYADKSSNARPVHKICVKGFWIDKYEVTQGEFKKSYRR